MEILFHQYALIREGRTPFFNYCGLIKRDHLNKNLESFGGRSVQQILVHINNTYLFWLGHFAQLKPTSFASHDHYTTMNQIVTLFSQTDDLVNRFLEKQRASFDEPIVNTVPMREFRLAVLPLQLFTHVITHEYHHKGQVLSMSRQLGYEPVDTDLIRF